MRQTPQLRALLASSWTAEDRQRGAGLVKLTQEQDVLVEEVPEELVAVEFEELFEQNQ